MKILGDNYEISIPSDANIEEVLELVYGAMILETFHPETVLQGMIYFGQMRIPDED